MAIARQNLARKLEEEKFVPKIEIFENEEVISRHNPKNSNHLNNNGITYITQVAKIATLQDRLTKILWIPYGYKKNRELTEKEEDTNAIYGFWNGGTSDEYILLGQTKQNIGNNVILINKVIELGKIPIQRKSEVISELEHYLHEDSNRTSRGIILKLGPKIFEKARAGIENYYSEDKKFITETCQGKYSEHQLNFP